MMNVDNLNIEKDILPLFDSTLNYNSRLALIDFLKNKPKNIEEVTYRQEIIKSFINQLPDKKVYNYSKTEYNEVYQKLKDIEPKNHLKIKFHAATKLNLQSNLMQIYIFLNKIYTFLKSLDIEIFPSEFHLLLESMIKTLRDIKTEETYLSIRNNKFKNKQIIEVNELILNNKKNLNYFYDALHLFEVYLSISQKAIKNQFTFPKISLNNEIELVNFYFPLLKNPVKNNFKTSKKVIVLTGANMSGKSTFFRAIAFCNYMGNLGLPVPCDTATIPFYQTISINIDHKDNVLKGYSHFMNEIINLKNYLINGKNGKNGFAVFDELFSGTNSVDAINLLTKTINGLKHFQNSLTFISTHYYEIQEKIEHLTEVDFLHLECIIENNTPKYTYKIKQGWSDIKVGQLIFENEGLDDLLK